MRALVDRQIDGAGIAGRELRYGALEHAEFILNILVCTEAHREPPIIEKARARRVRKVDHRDLGRHVAREQLPEDRREIRDLRRVGVVTKPFKFEGKRRMDQAMVGINELLGKVDSLLIIPNDRLKFATDQKVTLANAFEIADDVLRQAVVSISDLIKNTGFINLDFADVTCVMKDAGFAHMGVGRAAGKGKAEDAARMAVASPLMETSINGARGVLINITGSEDMGLEDVETAANLVQEAAHPDANIIFGASFDPSLDDEIRVSVIATGFDEPGKAQARSGCCACRRYVQRRCDCGHGCSGCRSGSGRCTCCPGCRSGCGCRRTRGGRSVRQHLQDLQLQVSFIICPKPPSLLVKAVFAFCERRQSIERLAHYPRPYDHGGHVSHPPRDALGG